MTEMTLFGTAFQLRFQFKQTFVASLQNFAHSGEASLHDARALQTALSGGRMTITLGPVLGDCECFLPQDLLPYLFFRGSPVLATLRSEKWPDTNVITRVKDYSSVAVGLLNFSVFLNLGFYSRTLVPKLFGLSSYQGFVLCGLASSTMLPDMITNYNL